jgi:hypothetical protein
MQPDRHCGNGSSDCSNNQPFTERYMASLKD